MQKLQSNPAESFSYYGDREGWLVAYSQHRDSDILDKANFEAIHRELQAQCEDEPDTYAIETFSHWLVGHGDWLLVKLGSHAADIAERINERIERDHPVVDDQLYSDMEYAAAIDILDQVLSSYGYPHNEDVKAFIYSWIEDGCGHDSVGYAGLDSYWPEKHTIFFAYLAYRRSQRS